VSQVEFLDLEDLLSLMVKLGAGPVRDIGLLESATARPRTSLFGENAYPTRELKAAALMHSIVANHALVDGNKRLGLLAAGTFMKANGLRVALSQDDAFDLTMAMAEGLSDLAQISARLLRESRGGHRPE
jgi:death on curing protein